jgi:hypothetical protein
VEMMFSILVRVKRIATTALVDQVRQEAVPVVNRRDPRATRRAPRLTRRRAREAPVDPPGRAVSWSRRHFRCAFAGVDAGAPALFGTSFAGNGASRSASSVLSLRMLSPVSSIL